MNATCGELKDQRRLTVLYRVAFFRLLKEASSSVPLAKNPANEDRRGGIMLPRLAFEFPESSFVRTFLIVAASPPKATVSIYVLPSL